jgi:ABC-type multidrug transport system fused ATPase/permease subunit
MQHADSIVVLDAGHVVAQGALNDLLRAQPTHAASLGRNLTT